MNYLLAKMLDFVRCSFWLCNLIESVLVVFRNWTDCLLDIGADFRVRSRMFYYSFWGIACGIGGKFRGVQMGPKR